MICVKIASQFTSDVTIHHRGTEITEEDTEIITKGGFKGLVVNSFLFFLLSSSFSVFPSMLSVLSVLSVVNITAELFAA